MKTEHTSGPLNYSSGMIWAGKGEETPIADMNRIPGNGTTPTERDENAKRIVLTWNCHDDLLSACKTALAEIRGVPRRKGTLTRLLNTIAKAEGGAE